MTVTDAENILREVLRALSWLEEATREEISYSYEALCKSLGGRLEDAPKSLATVLREPRRCKAIQTVFEKSLTAPWQDFLGGGTNSRAKLNYELADWYKERKKQAHKWAPQERAVLDFVFTALDPLPPKMRGDASEAAKKMIAASNDESLESFLREVNDLLTPPSVEPETAEKLKENSPIVTIFGAGVTGLSVAHELIERGFRVQVVEKRRDKECEYELKAGGMARSQPARIKQTTVLHPYLFSEDQRESKRYLKLVEDGHIIDEDVKNPERQAESVHQLRRLRTLPFQRLQRRFPLPQHIVMPEKKDWKKEGDSHGTSNVEKLNELATIIAAAYLTYAEDLRQDAKKVLEREGTKVHLSDRMRRREKLLIEIRAHVRVGNEEDNENALKRAKEVREFLAEKMRQLMRKNRSLVNEIFRLFDLALEEIDKAIDEAQKKGPSEKELEKRFESAIEKAESAEKKARELEGEWSEVLRTLLTTGLVRRLQACLDILKQLRLLLEGGSPPSPEAPQLCREFDDEVARLRQALGERKAAAVEAKNGLDDLKQRLVFIRHLVARVERRRSWAQDDLDYVDFRVVEHEMPGEHGYHFFPAYYRHLFDVMKRTPLLDDWGKETGRTTFDQLVVPPPVAMGLKDTEHFQKVPRRRYKSLEELRDSLRVFLVDMGLSERDVQRYAVQLLKFMTSCPERRLQYEDMSWLRYADGEKEFRPQEKTTKKADGKATDGSTKKADGEGTDGPTEKGENGDEELGFSPRAAELLREVSQALIAMDAVETEALTHGITTVQLLLDYLSPTDSTDMTLNGPKDEAWFRPWKAYLKRQGVKFFIGTLSKLEVDEGDRLLPTLKGPAIPEEAEDTYYCAKRKKGPVPDFYVLALPVEGVAHLVWKSWAAIRKTHPSFRFQGDFRKLMRFTEAGRLVSPGQDGIVALPERHETGLPKPQFEYPLRELSGIQYFFPSHVRLGEGHLVFPDSPWGLSSISQFSHWRHRPSHTHGALGQLSVDIGDFYQVDPELEKTAWNSTRDEIARTTWRQLLEATGKEYAHRVQEPRFFHLDASLVFHGDPAPPHHDKEPHPHRKQESRHPEGTIAFNHSPFLINLPGQWSYRPGVWDRPTHPRYPDKKHISVGERRVWYEVSHDRWVLAGTFMATLTRLTTMEAANESARHAVNSILHELMATARPELYNGGGRLIGDYCPIFDPESYELPDFEPLKRLDKALLDARVPHFIDVLGIPELIDAMPGHDLVEDRPLRNLLKLLELGSTQPARDWSFVPSLHDGLVDLATSGLDHNLRELVRSGNLTEALRLLREHLEPTKREAAKEKT